MTSDPFHPPDSTQPSSLAFLPYFAAASALLGVLLTCCCGVIGAFFAWLLPMTFMLWGVLLYASPKSTEDLRSIGKHTAIVGFIGLLLIPVSFAFSLCFTMLFVIPAEFGQVVMDTIMSA